MAILFRNTADLTIGGMTARLTVYSGSSDRIRVEIAPYDAAVKTVYTGSLQVTVTYNGEKKVLSADPFTGAVSAVFGAVSGVKTVTLSSAKEIVYGGTASGSLTVSWKGDGSVPAPSLGISSYSALLIGSPARVEWSVDGVPEGYRAYTVGVWMYFAPLTRIEPDYTRSCLIGEKIDAFALEHSIPGLEEKNIVFYRIAVGLYPEDTAETAGRDDYVLYLEIDSPAYVCSGDLVYTIAPCNIRCGGLRKNRTVEVKWDLLPAATKTAGFRLQYSYDKSTWTDLFWGVWDSSSCLFTVPAGKDRVAFRIQAYSIRSKYENSDFVYTPWIRFGGTNVYVGRNGNSVPASGVYVGSVPASAVLSVG